MNDDSLADTQPAPTAIDPLKPMRMYFTRTSYPVVGWAVCGSNIFVRPDGQTAWFRFNRADGTADYPSHRLVNEAPPPRKYTQKIALIEHRDTVYPYSITPAIEEYGVEKYLRGHIAGKCIAIKTVTFTEGEGDPPVY